MISIAIDGPSGAGKSTISRKLSQKFGYIYVDTGALYRAVGLYVIRADKNTKNASEVVALLSEINLELKYISGEQKVFLNGKDVSEAIRDEAVSMAASNVSAHSAVRDFLLETQRRLARQNNVIMDGRDIGTVVLPNATVKIFLTATPEERAQRRYKQLLESGREADYEKVLKDVIQRDHNDTTRDISPLKKADDGIEVNTTGVGFEESIEKLGEIISENVEGISD